MSRVVLELERGGKLGIVAGPTGKRLFEALCHTHPKSVEIAHVKWSGDALYFLFGLGVEPLEGEAAKKMEEGSVTYFPALAEVILAYGDAAPRGRDGTIEVYYLGEADDIDALHDLGMRIWRGGTETAKVWVDRDSRP